MDKYPMDRYLIVIRNEVRIIQTTEGFYFKTDLGLKEKKGQ